MALAGEPPPLATGHSEAVVVFHEHERADEGQQGADHEVDLFPVRGRGDVDGTRGASEPVGVHCVVQRRGLLLPRRLQLEERRGCRLEAREGHAEPGVRVGVVDEARGVRRRLRRVVAGVPRRGRGGVGVLLELLNEGLEVGRVEDKRPPSLDAPEELDKLVGIGAREEVPLPKRCGARELQLGRELGSTEGALDAADPVERLGEAPLAGDEDLPPALELALGARDEVR